MSKLNIELSVLGDAGYDSECYPYTSDKKEQPIGMWLKYDAVILKNPLKKIHLY